MSRFDKTYCSQCGREFGPGDSGYSHCVDHTRRATPMAQIGDTIWHFDENRRVYERDDTGRAFGGPIYAEYYKPYKIVGEEARSWIVESNTFKQKVAKNRIDRSPTEWFSDAARLDNIWKHDHRHKIRNLIDQADAATLRKVAEIVGYRPSPNDS